MNKTIFFVLIISVFFNSASFAMEAELPDENSSQAIFEAVKSGNSGRVLALIQADPTVVDARDGAWQETPLHAVGHGNHVGIARILLENGADVDALNLIQETPLDSAVNFCSDSDGVIDSDMTRLLGDWMCNIRVEQIRDSLFVFVMAGHPRLGANSPVQGLGSELRKMICEMAYAISHKKIYEIARQEIRREEKERKKITTNLLMFFEEERIRRSQQRESQQGSRWCSLQ